MDDQIVKYASEKRQAGMSDEQIKSNLVAKGWDLSLVQAALIGKDNNDAPAPPSGQASVHPVAVVQTFTTKGLEYIIMFISLWVSATAVGYLLHQSVDAAFSPNDNSWAVAAPFATAALVVALPIFSLLFLRLKKMENTQPEIKNDPSRKRAIQLTLVVTFLIGLGHIISYVYSLIAPSDTSYVGSGIVSPIGNFLHLLVTLVIAGGIFVYYWIDQHRRESNA